MLRKFQLKLWLIFTLKQLFNYDISVIYQKSDDKNYLTDNPNRRCPIISKARNVLKFNPKIYVEEGVRRFLEYLAIERIQ